MSTVIPITTDAPRSFPAPSAGQLLSARERGAVRFRERLEREFVGTGPKRSSDFIAGYRSGWDDAVAFLRAAGEIR